MISSTLVNTPRIWSFFMGLFLTLTLVLGGVFVLHFYFDYRSEITKRNSSEILNVGLARNALVEDIDAVTTDLMFLKGLFERIEYIPQNNQTVFFYIAEIFTTFAREKRLYDQIRFLDLNGHEVVRVNYRKGNSELVDSQQLQDKSRRYYVSQALKLNRDQIYLSPLDLNIESGKIEQPVKPVLRLATPVFDVDGKRRGLIILNYLGNRLLERFRQVSANIKDHIYLLNGSGYWLSSPRPDESWGFMFGTENTFQSRYQDAWNVISEYENGQFENTDGLFTFSTVSPTSELSRALPTRVFPELDNRTWKVVSHVHTEYDILGLTGFISRHALLYLGILVLFAVLAYLLASAHVQRRWAEEQHAYELKFRQTLEDINLVALMLDVHGKLTFCNHFLLELTGWSLDEVVGRQWIDSFVPHDQQDHDNRIMKQLEQNGVFPREYEGEVRTRTGERRLISWNNTLSRDAAGKVIGVTAIGEDITEKRRAGDQVRKLSRAVDQSPASVVITNREGLIEYVNPKFTQITGYSAEEVIGKNPRILRSGETPSSEYSQLWEALKAGGEWRGEFHNRRKDGSLYWEAAVISALRDHDGEITHFLAVKEDITERKRLEQEVDSRNLELARAHALTTMGSMASMLAHDLSNPLSSVKMAVQILGKQAVNSEVQELAEISQEQVNYMEGIITEMLTYARPGELNSSWLDPEKLMTAVMGTVQRRIIEFGVKVTTHCAPGLPTFPGDASKLRQLITNLIVNALQAAAVRPPGQGQVHVNVGLEMTAEGRQLNFTICDNGEGVDPEIRDQLFEPFFTTRAKGTGLGLAIVQQITDLHGGSVQFSDNEPSGTCVVVSLPLIPAVSTWQQAQVSIEKKRESA